MNYQKDMNEPSFRIGFGYDIHRLEKHPPVGQGKLMTIGGVLIDNEYGPVGKTDADVFLHALIDAILGALALPTMGDLFSKDDPRKHEQNSEVYLTEALLRITELGWVIGNLDSTVILEKPKINNRKTEIIKNVSSLLSCDESRVNIKIKTKEGVDAVGAGNAIEAHVVILLYKQILKNLK